jgi:hypothetical protein
MEPALVDLLLDSPDLVLFTSQPVYGHGGGHRGLSSREKVQGKESQCLVRILAERPAAERILAGLRASLSAGPGRPRLRYWLVPVLASGEI